MTKSRDSDVSMVTRPVWLYGITNAVIGAIQTQITFFNLYLLLM